MLSLSPNITRPTRTNINQGGLIQGSGVGPGREAWNVALGTKPRPGFRLLDRFHSSSVG